MKTWVFVAAEAVEFQGIIRRLEDVQRLELPVKFARMGKSDGRSWVFVADGPGPRLAAKAADAVRQRGMELDALISTGFCGGLDPALAIGDIVAGSRVLEPNGREFPAHLPETRRTYATGAVISVDRVATMPKEKEELRAAGAVAVEMEAAAIARRAAEWNVPFYCVRTVSDTAGQGFAIDFNTVRDAEGRFNRIRVLRAALGRPFSRVPELLRLRKRCRFAAGTLGEFLADCRF